MYYYVDVSSNEYTFYFNTRKAINSSIAEVLPKEILDYINSEFIDPNGIGSVGSDKKMVSYNFAEGSADIRDAIDLAGISADVSSALAKKILERAKYYCPVDTGTLVNSGTIENLGGGRSRILFNCPYAFYVHEFTWKKHQYPKSAKFLTLAIQEVMGVL